MPPTSGSGTAEVADPVGEAAGCCACIVGDLGEFVAEQVDGHTLQAVGAVEAVEPFDHILNGEVLTGHIVLPSS